MRAIYRCHFELRPEGTPLDTLRAIAGMAADWVFSPNREGVTKPEYFPVELVAQPWRGQVAEASWVELLPVETEGRRLWGFRFQHPDHEDDHIGWTTEVGLAETAAGTVSFSCTLSVGRADGSFVPFYRNVSSPRIVSQIVSRFQTTGLMSLRPGPLLLNANEKVVQMFADFLESPERRHPVVLFSTDDEDLLAADVEKTVAPRLAGLAHVVVAQDHSVSELLSAHYPDQLNCFDGAVRIYWPAFSKRANPYHHPIFKRQRLEFMAERSDWAIGQFILSKLADVAVYNVPASFINWPRLDSLKRHSDLAEARETGDWEQIATLYSEENAELQAINQLQEEELSKQSSELSRQRDEAQQWKQLYLALCQSTGQQPEEDVDEVPVDSVEAAIARIERDYPDAIVFSLNSKSDPSTPYQEPGEVLDALVWLATDYRDQKLGQSHIIDLNLHLHERVDGWSYKGGQTIQTKSKFAEWYECLAPDGKKQSIEEHIGRGSNKDPRYTVRIAFTWWEEGQKVLVGFVGQHQRTTGT